jgi:glycerol dehydrogenase-like iron-containing ADH family enzyme
MAAPRADVFVTIGPAQGGLPRVNGFRVIFGRELARELDSIARPPYLLVTMENLWPKFEPDFRAGLGKVHRVQSIEMADLDRALPEYSDMRSVIGVGGGQALDVAKYFAWRLGLELFQFPTALSANAAFAHRAGVRVDGVARYVGWVQPELVSIDWDVIRGAPPGLTRGGASDILCYHTAHWDWAYADRIGRAEARWPFSSTLTGEAAAVMQALIADAHELHDLTDRGIRTLVDGLRWGGAAFAFSGWTPRHIEGSEHFFLYALESVTGKRFVHGQAVGLGILLMSALQDNAPEEIRDVLDTIGINYRPSDMGISWDDAGAALKQLPQTVTDADLWYTVASDHVATDDFIAAARTWVESDGGEFNRSVLKTTMR